MKLKTLSILCLAALCTFTFTACGSSTQSSSSQESDAKTETVTNDEISELYTDPGKFKGKEYDFTAQVLDVEKDSGTLYIQAFHDIVNSDDNTIIIYDGDISLKDNDYIKVKSVVKGERSGKNALGEKVSAPEVEASSVKKIDAAEAIPAEKTFDVNQSVTKGNVTATVKKVDFTSDSTRIYLSIKNDGSDTFETYPDQGVVIQNGKQKDPSYDFDYGEFSSEIRAGITAEGIIAFPKLETAPFTYEFTGYDSDMNEITFTYDFKDIK